MTIEEQPHKFGTERLPVPGRIKREPDSISLDKIGVEAVDLTADVADGLGYSVQTKGTVNFAH